MGYATHWQSGLPSKEKQRRTWTFWSKDLLSSALELKRRNERSLGAIGEFIAWNSGGLGRALNRWIKPIKDCDEIRITFISTERGEQKTFRWRPAEQCLITYWKRHPVMKWNLDFVCIRLENRHENRRERNLSLKLISKQWDALSNWKTTPYYKPFDVESAMSR